MINSTLCFVAETVIQDTQTNLVSAVSIIDGIVAEGFPLLMTKMTILAIWEKETADPEKYDATLTINLDEDKLLENNLNIDFKGHNKNRSIVAISGLVIKKPGILEIKMSIPNRADAKYCFTIEAQKSVLESSSNA